MSRWVYLVLTVLAIVAVVYIYMHRQQLGLVSAPSSTSAQMQNAVDTSPETSPEANSQPGPETVPAQIVWQKVDRTPDGFRLQMPLNAKEIQVPAYTADESADQVNMLLSAPDAETTYSIAWADDPPVVRATGRSVQHTFDAARDGALARTQTTLTNETKTTVQGFPARDFTGMNAEGGLFNARMVLAGNRLYMLMAAFPSGGARSQKDVTQFFNDFRVTRSSSLSESPAFAPANGD